MDLSIKYNKAKSMGEAFDLAKEQITPEYVAKFKVKSEISYDPEKGIMIATGKGFTLTLKFIESECEVTVKLSLLLKPLRGKILEAIERKLQKHT